MNSKEMTQQVADDIVNDITKAYNYELRYNFMRDEEEDDEWNPYEDENTLSYYIMDNLEVKYIVDENLEYDSCIITLGYGGPNVYFHTDTGRVEVFWENHATEYVDNAIKNMIDDMMCDHYNNYVKH